jgi:UDP-N-acetylglucosamine--N-acetylmuramyl-(pentapeptide) pyrophosphoryl-undecaprenol N-acetylglucosamine transferase
VSGDQPTLPGRQLAAVGNSECLMMEQSVTRTQVQLTGNIVLAGGGSGGHINAAVAIAEQILQLAPEARLTFITSDRPLDRTLLDTAQLPADTQVIPQPMRHLGWLRRRPIQFLRGLFKSIQLCRRTFRFQRPALVVGMGGFASVPPVMLAQRWQIPTVVVEQNCIPGRATRLLTSRSTVTCMGLPVSRDHLPGLQKPIVTGVPLRAAFLSQPRQHATTPGSLTTGSRCRLVVLGGSQGAQQINELLTAAVGDDASLFGNRWELFHQTGKREAAEMQEHWQRHNIKATVRPFFDDPAHLIGTADLLISRAGAMTIAEICAASKAAVLIPMAASADGHQQANASWLSGQGAALMVNPTGEKAASQLRSMLQVLLNDHHVRSQLATAAGDLAQPDAARAIAEQVILNARQPPSTADDPQPAVFGPRVVHNFESPTGDPRRKAG